MVYCFFWVRGLGRVDRSGKVPGTRTGVRPVAQESVVPPTYESCGRPGRRGRSASRRRADPADRTDVPKVPETIINPESGPDEVGVVPWEVASLFQGTTRKRRPTPCWDRVREGKFVAPTSRYTRTNKRTHPIKSPSTPSRVRVPTPSSSFRRNLLPHPPTPGRGFGTCGNRWVPRRPADRSRSRTHGLLGRPDR